MGVSLASREMWAITALPLNFFSEQHDIWSSQLFAGTQNPKKFSRI
jgi:hypothetical protein